MAIMKKNSGIGRQDAENPMRIARVAAGITQQEAAEKLSCHIRTLQQYEAGKTFPRQDVLMKMVRIYSCKVADLFPKE